MDKVRVEVTVKGGITRPPYNGTVEVNMDSFTKGELQEVVWRKLQRSSFPEIHKDDVVIKAARFTP